MKIEDGVLTEAWMQIKDGVLKNIRRDKNQRDISRRRLMNTNVNAAIKACVVKVPIIGDLIVATIPLQDSYM